jgi:hypothetical protein
MPRINNKEEEKRRTLAWAANQLQQAQKDGLFGKVSVVMEDGIIRRIVKEESILPTSDLGG